MKLDDSSHRSSLATLTVALVLSGSAQSCRSCANQPPQPSPAHDSSTAAQPEAPNPIALLDAGGPPADESTPAVAPIPVKLGCFAWSQSLQSALCVTGQWGMGRAREWSVERFGPVRAAQDAGLFSTVIANDEDGTNPDDPLASQQLQHSPVLSTIAPALDAEVRHGRYVANDFHDQPVGELRGRSPDLNYRWQNATIRTRRIRVSPARNNSAARYTDTLSIQWEESANWVTIATYEDEPVEQATMRVASLPSGQLLIISERSWAEEGSFAKMINVQICDPTSRLCR